MTQPRLLIFATRYDAVTQRTYGIAQRLLTTAERSGIAVSPLFEAAAISRSLLKAIAASRPEVVAFYSHGNDDGVILAQDRQACWTAETVPDLSGTVLFAHACRGMLWLKEHATHLRSRLLIGYEKDLISPAIGSARFWDIYEELHSFAPLRIAAGGDDAEVRRSFYELCTKAFHELNKNSAPLMELLAIIQSRDEIVFSQGASGMRP